MAKINKVWVYNYKVRHPDYIGYYGGEITVSTHKEDPAERALAKARTKVVSTLNNRNIELDEQHEVEISLDVSYVI